ncbi:MAG: NADH-quinone oxidoreductase subunit K [Gemmatimonadota bacterium]|nr:NADH-quinone oxidoreductase subunit K [Gemmatimonadota bacterium]MDH3422151.1 NADH-quinone oxidoreductase subunit K [Gemmatimonadota bacterium]
MTSFALYPLAGVVVLTIGLWGLVTRPHLLTKVLAFNLTATGASLVLVGLAARPEGGTDPVPQAMVLTGIVVAVSATALALALIARLSRVDPGAVESSD